MNVLKHKYLTIIALTLISVAMQLVLLLAPTSVQAAITDTQKKACYDKYNGNGTGRGTNDILTSARSAEYNAGNCDTRKGGNCSVNVSSQGAIITCTDPSASSTGAGSSTANLDDPTTADDCKADSYSELADGTKQCGIFKYITRITNVLSAIAGLVIIAMIIVGGIQYAMAGAEPAKVQAARKKITNALLALVLFMFGFGFLQWLIPGGIF